MAWAWDAGHTPENWLPQGDETLTRDTPNAWGVYTADPALGLLYIPTGNAPPDNWGGSRRPFDDATSSATIALDIETGARKWTFQTVHHDVWERVAKRGGEQIAPQRAVAVKQRLDVARATAIACQQVIAITTAQFVSAITTVQLIAFSQSK